MAVLLPRGDRTHTLLLAAVLIDPIDPSAPLMRFEIVFLPVDARHLVSGGGPWQV
jgi:hypothetical protein